MLDELYDDVLSVMTEKGFISWYERNHRHKTSPLKWCYESSGELMAPPKPPNGLSWIGYTYDSHLYSPHTILIDNDGNVGPHNRH